MLENKYWRQHMERTARDGQRRKLACEIVSAGYRAMAPKLHPDCGGTAHDMALHGSS
jgi:hypothetical protein